MRISELYYMNSNITYKSSFLSINDIYPYHLYDIERKQDNIQDIFFATSESAKYIADIQRDIRKNGIKEEIIVAKLDKKYHLPFKYYVISGRHRIFAIQNDPYLKCKYKDIYCYVITKNSFNK